MHWNMAFVDKPLGPLFAATENSGRGLNALITRLEPNY